MARSDPIACLFDLDGTVLDSRKCGSGAFLAALDEIYGWADPLDGVLIAGRTDRKIFHDVYAKYSERPPGGPGWAEEVEKFKRLYLAHLERLMKGRPPLLHPGYPELFAAAASAAGMGPGIATGNFKRGAQLKLAACGIEFSRFAFGSFGCETESRPDLLSLAVERARFAAGGEVKPVVIGDTPEDLRAAREIGAPCALVATGPYAREELEGLGADFFAENLADAAAFLEWLASLR